MNGDGCIPDRVAFSARECACPGECCPGGAPPSADVRCDLRLARQPGFLQESNTRTAFPHELGIETRTVEAFEDFGGRDHRVICSVRRRLRVVSVGAQGHDDRLAETLVRWPRAGFRRAIRTTRRCQMLKCSAPIWDIRAGTVRWPAGASRFSRLSRLTRHRRFSLPTRSSQSPGCIVSRIGS